MTTTYDLVIHAETILPMTGAAPLKEGAVAIVGSQIAFVGAQKDLPNLPAKHTLRYPKGTLCPGLINLHAHLPHSLLLGVGDGLPVDKWLHELIFPIERSSVDKEFVQVGTELAIAQMLAAGVTLCVDMYYFESAMAEVVARTGYRAVLGQTVIGYQAPDAENANEGLALAERFLEEWHNHERITPALAPHSTYTTTPEILRKVEALRRRSGAPLLIHLSESTSEIATLQERQGKTPIAYLESLGMLEPSSQMIGAHVIYPELAGDLPLLAKGRVAVAHCPQSNLHMGETLAPIAEYLAAGLPLGLGTDGAGSAPCVDLLLEAALCGRLMKARARRADGASAEQLLHLVTSSAARALGRPDLGTLQAGSLADLVVFEATGPVFPRLLCDPYSYLVYAHAHRTAVLTVVSGKVLYDRGTYPTIDLASLRDRVKRQENRMREAVAHVQFF